MANPLDPLHRLADTNNPTASTNDLLEQDRQIKAALDAMPDTQRRLAQARTAIAHELHRRGMSIRKLAALYKVSPTRIQQILAGDSSSASQRRTRAAKDTDTEKPDATE